MKPLLEITDLYASVGEIKILNGVNLTINPGEVHAIMGPNGSGKSTLANVLAGNPAYVVTNGGANIEGEDLIPLLPEDRARRGLFLSFQHPVEIPGVRMDHFMRASLNPIRKHRGQDEIGILDFDRLVSEKIQVIDMSRDMAKRALNVGFSGGEKKRNEILQMAILEPRIAILDEPDSGLDVDALRIVASGINQLRHIENSTLLITHYQRILDYITPDYVHIMIKGRIVESGDKSLALDVEKSGYDQFEKTRQ
jgi:Fe-S cluster assembly ATP-binding protein